MDSDKITMGVFAPPAPGSSPLSISDEWVRKTLKTKGAMVDNFFNQCVVYWDYDESGGDDEDNFDQVVIVNDATSQAASNWGEIARKEIKSKWIRSRTIGQPSNITGCVVYHVNLKNDSGNGTLAYNSTNETLTWTSPGDTAGAAVTVDRDGKFQLFSGTTTKYIRVVVTQASLPGSDQNDTLAITLLSGSNYATALATHWVVRYANPQAEIMFQLPIAEAIHEGNLLRVSDIVEITSDQIITKGEPGWTSQSIFLLSTDPDFKKRSMTVSGLHTSFDRRYGFISPSGHTDDYDAADSDEREYAFVSDGNDQVGTANDPGYYIW
jgi:hypothetical protein